MYRTRITPFKVKVNKILCAAMHMGLESSPPFLNVTFPLKNNFQRVWNKFTKILKKKVMMLFNQSHKLLMTGKMDDKFLLLTQSGNRTHTARHATRDYESYPLSNTCSVNVKL